ncbi:hypothetical protein BGW36DRAFT_48415 [Talaromyces proteolyticus]|uniref:Uncharacterized protein n=1 Tax=Talaromyces proteolyticus TaxID=1131652 RepID=A0AAD4KGH1_9EURO|nr:uncharacterized protein BGW36DRAFT_48415 [Talaromyces proteolyticus]KAH8691195.1 hypothetical protein BGW36DRAFT_48415 [Talaromyces proteolyticus]
MQDQASKQTDSQIVHRNRLQKVASLAAAGSCGRADPQRRPVLCLPDRPHLDATTLFFLLFPSWPFHSRRSIAHSIWASKRIASPGHPNIKNDPIHIEQPLKPSADARERSRAWKLRCNQPDSNTPPAISIHVIALPTPIRPHAAARSFQRPSRPLQSHCGITIV